MSATAVATGPTPALSRGPGANVKLLPTFSLNRMETSLDPLLATIRSSRPSPLKSATVIPTGLVPVKKP